MNKSNVIHQYFKAGFHIDEKEFINSFLDQLSSFQHWTCAKITHKDAQSSFNPIAFSVQADNAADTRNNYTIFATKNKTFYFFVNFFDLSMEELRKRNISAKKIFFSKIFEKINGNFCDSQDIFSEKWK